MERFRYIKLSQTTLLIFMLILSSLVNTVTFWLGFLAFCLLFFLESYILKITDKEYKNLYKSAYYDSLTGIPNRQSADFYCKKRLNSKNLSAATADLDNLKFINDTFGHTAGDQFIKDFASIFYKSASPYGFSARNGGDEFLAIFDGPDSEEAMKKFCRSLEEAISAHNAGSSRPIQYSIGCSFLQKDGCEDIFQLISLADQRMYQQKEQRRKTIPKNQT